MATFLPFWPDFQGFLDPNARARHIAQSAGQKKGDDTLFGHRPLEVKELCEQSPSGRNAALAARRDAESA
jgi:hypothetical protein